MRLRLGDDLGRVLETRDAILELTIGDSFGRYLSLKLREPYLAFHEHCVSTCDNDKASDREDRGDEECGPPRVARYTPSRCYDLERRTSARRLRPGPTRLVGHVHRMFEVPA